MHIICAVSFFCVCAMQVYNQPEGEEERGYKEIKYEQQVHKFKTLLWLVMTTKWVG